MPSSLKLLCPSNPRESNLVDLLELDLAKKLSAWCLSRNWNGDIQDEVGVGGDETREGLTAVGEVAGDVESGLLAELHLHNALVPA